MRIFRLRRSVRRLFYLCFLITPLPVVASGVNAGECGDDGFCSIISIQNEVEKRVPQRAGAVVGTIGDDGFQPAPSAHVSAKTICKKEVRVPRVVHAAVSRMFENVNSRGGMNSFPATLTPAEQTMLLYYNTIMQQTMNFQCNAK